MTSNGIRGLWIVALVLAAITAGGIYRLTRVRATPPPSVVATRGPIEARAGAPPDTSRLTAGSPNDPWDDARARGVSVRAVGNEPGWMLEIVEGDRVTMIADYGDIRVTLPAPAPTLDRATGRRRYIINTDAHRLDIRVEMRQCFDGMSGFEFPATVTAILDGKTNRGCGRVFR